MKDKKGLLVESKPTNYLYSHSRSCEGCNYCKPMNSPKDYLTDREKLMEKIRKILKSYNMPDSYLEHETNKWLSLLTSEVEKVLDRVDKEVIGYGDLIPNEWKDKESIPIALVEKAQYRQELRNEQRKSLSDIKEEGK